MMYKTHLAFSFLIGISLIQVMQPANQILFMLLVLFGSLLPDIDHPDSKIGNNIKIISFLFEHRGFFHSLFFVFILFLAFMSFHSYFRGIYSTAFIVGYFSHLVADSFTKEGIMLLHPLTKRRVRGFINTGGFFERVMFLFLVFFDIWVLIKF
ncbi:MAG: metal-dependent hydrolase [Candidatus Woesearchaeota archaeon]|nr:metal-dependent hydrolase [Candidatus Woesearchaeota archaeon]